MDTICLTGIQNSEVSEILSSQEMVWVVYLNGISHTGLLTQFNSYYIPFVVFSGSLLMEMKEKVLHQNN